MKICVFSDSHGSSEAMARAVDEHSPDLILHLGDGVRDAEKVKSQLPPIKLKSVWGDISSLFAVMGGKKPPGKM